MYNAIPQYDEYGDEIWFGGHDMGMWTVGPFIAGGKGESKQKSYELASQVALVSVAPDWLTGLGDLKCDLHDELTRLRMLGKYSIEVDDVLTMLKNYQHKVEDMLDQLQDVQVRLKKEVRGTHEWGEQ